MEKNKYLLFLCNVTFFLTFLIVFQLVQTVNAATIYVPGDYDTIQDAINASSTGDTVLVADGTYSGNILFGPGPTNKTSITLRSVNGPESTTIMGDGTGTVVTFGADINTTLDGFTIRNGSTSENGGGVLISAEASPFITNCIITNNRASSFGGGITVGSSASPTIDYCIITNNSASAGGGISVASSASPTITNSTITNNEASLRGGGFILADSAEPFIGNCTISNNLAPFGGGISCGDSSAPIITNSTFQNNSATGKTASDNGGGLHGAPYSTPIITNCDFIDNTSEQNGGAMAFDTAEPLIVNCTFDNNTAALSGGAISVLESAPKITNCSFSNNRAVTNPGGAISCNSPSPETTVTNSIFWGDHPAEIACDANTISVTYSDIQGGPAWPANSDMMGADRWPGTGNINADPRFLDQANGDFHLTNDSPCIDAGDNSDPDLQRTDIDGDDRKIDDPAVADTGNGDPPIVDMGAFEKYLDVESPPPIVGGNEWTPPGQVGGGGVGGGVGEEVHDCVDGNGDCPPGGIWGDILKSSVIGYHLDGWTAEGIEIYMPVTQGIKALKGAQEYVRSFAPNLARLVRECFDFLERKADADKEGFLYILGTNVFPVLGKIAEESLELIGEDHFIDAAYSYTTISVEEFYKLKKQGSAFTPKTVKDSVPAYFPMQELALTGLLF
jgi:parallel beta-helix repeat protein/predicted outer membrane repeat protein